MADTNTLKPRARARRWMLRAGGVLTVAIALIVWKMRVDYPFGYQACFVPCAANVLAVYVADHGGVFPNVNGDPFASLASIARNEPVFASYLAGLSGDKAEVMSRFGSGAPLDGAVCSWVFAPGVSSDAAPPVPVLWERRTGLGFNGRRTSGRPVIFSDGTWKQMPSDFDPAQAGRNTAQPSPGK